MTVKIKVDPDEIAKYINARIDVPYVPESVEYQVFRQAIDSVCKIAVEAIGEINVGPVQVTVED